MVTPHYRLEKSFARTGVPVARSTINDLFRRAGQKLEPLRSPLFETITKDFLIHVDETSFKLTTQTSKAFIWAFVGQSLTGYTFALTRGGDVPLDLLGKSTGAFLCDDYRGYDPLEKLETKGMRRRSGCLAHARRKYFEAGDVTEAKHDLITCMYLVEHEAERRAIVGTAEHLALRRRYTRPLFADLLRLARDQTTNDGAILLLDPRLVVLAVRARTRELDAGRAAIRQHGLVDCARRRMAIAQNGASRSHKTPHPDHPFRASRSPGVR